jgi:hypothetical protein
MTILSNRKWFKTYLIAKKIIVGAALLGFFWSFLDLGGFWGRFYNAITFPVLLILFLFEFVETPVLFEIEELEENMLNFKLFIPTSSYSYRLNEKKITKLEIGSKEKLSVQLIESKIPFLARKKCFFIIEKEDKTLIKTANIGLGWAGEKTLEKLTSIMMLHNQQAMRKR